MAANPHAALLRAARFRGGSGRSRRSRTARPNDLDELTRKIIPLSNRSVDLLGERDEGMHE
jgi:hypothetical protein